MKNIYFKTLKENKLKTRLLLATTKGFNRLMPKTSFKTFYKLLLNPHGRRKYSFGEDLIPTQQFKLRTQLGFIQVYYFKAGAKNILFTHGWADNSRSFKKMILSQLEQGHSCWVFDHIGHGKSEGDTAHVFGFIDGLETVIKHINKNQKLDAIITHSMAGIAVMNLNKNTLKDLQIIMISLPSQFVSALYTRLNKMGIHSDILENLMGDVASNYGRDWKNLAADLNIDKLPADSLLIHDKEDQQALYQPSCDLFKKNHLKVFSTIGLGHKRILVNEEVLTQTANFLTK